MMVGYARVSTHEQDTALQIDALSRAGCGRIFRDEGVSGSIGVRSELTHAIDALRPGDTLVTWRLDRLGRSLSHLISLIAALEKRGVAFRSLSEAIDTRSAGGRLLFHIMGALAEFECRLISERTKAGLAAARSRGRQLGRRRKLSAAQARLAASRLLGGCLLHTLADELSVSPITVRRAVRRIKSAC
jgi:DNA invertase Pin-like site-specific DNA recombinase